MCECTAQCLTGQLVAGKPEWRTEQCKQDAATGNGGELQHPRQQQFTTDEETIPVQKVLTFVVLLASG
jgi:hypothetical protein